MTDDIINFLQKISTLERASGMMTAFQALSKEDQIKLLEWSRSACIRMANYFEKQQVIIISGTNESIDLPVPKIFADIAIKVGVIHGTMRSIPELVESCQAMYRHIFGEPKGKVIDDFREVVELTVKIAKWQ